MAKAGPPTYTLTALAEYCDVSPATVSAWLDRGMPAQGERRKGRTQQIDLKQAVRWLIVHRDSTEGSQRERLAKEQADKLALENERQRGRLIFSHQVAEVLSSLAAELASRMTALPGRVASEFAGTSDAAVIRGRLLDEIRIIRGSFADAADKLADALGSSPDAGEDIDAAEEEKPKRVGRRKQKPAARKRRARTVAKPKDPVLHPDL